MLGALLTAALATFALHLVLAANQVSSARRRRVLLFVLPPLVLVTLTAHALRRPEPTDYRPVAADTAGYLTSQSCRACHPRQYASWHGSYHRTMTQVPSAATIGAPFDGRRVEVDGRTYRFQQRGDEFWVEHPSPVGVASTGPGSGDRESRVVLVTGSHHYQVFWTETGEGRRIATLPIVYLLDEQRWIPRESAFIMPSRCDAERYGPNPGGQWNVTCLQCHATRGRPRIRGTGQADTLVAEFGIACEACHGPGYQHVRANHNPLRRYGLHRDDEPDPTIVQPERLDAARSSQVCGQCHSVNILPPGQTAAQTFNEEGFAYRPGDELTESRVLLGAGADEAEAVQQALADDPYLLRDTLWSDGMVRVAGREYNGLIASPCFAGESFTCLSCHEMHPDAGDSRPLSEWADDQLRPKMRTDHACLQCHEELSRDISAHTHHAAESTGSRCYNCHMPYTTYGLLKAIRSHQIDVPDVASTLATGRPNACNLCHLDQTLSWTSGHLAAWYGQDEPELEDPDHEELAASVVWMLKGDAGQRALLAWAMSWPPAQEASGTEWMAPVVAPLLEDPYDAVRWIAARTLEDLDALPTGYDFLAGPDELAAAHRRARSAWEASAGATGRHPRLLLDEGGRVRQDVLDRLQSERDDQRIVLNE